MYGMNGDDGVFVLKRCPFCGEKPDFVFNALLWPQGVQCPGCEKFVEIRANESESGTAWAAMEKIAAEWNQRALTGE